MPSGSLLFNMACFASLWPFQYEILSRSVFKMLMFDNFCASYKAFKSAMTGANQVQTVFRFLCTDEFQLCHTSWAEICFSLMSASRVCHHSMNVLSVCLSIHLVFIVIVTIGIW